ncbi:unnamed protein product [Natator depressus]
MGLIRPSCSAWASPVVLVPKPDGEIRFCMDYRKLNAVTRPDNYPMPRTDEFLEKLGWAQFISTLNLTKGYWQVLLDKSAKERSAFITHAGLYELNVLPFGLRNAPATFQRLVDGLLEGLGEYAVTYLDNVAIFRIPGQNTWNIYKKSSTGFRVTAVLVCIRKKKRSTCGTLETNQFI